MRKVLRKKFVFAGFLFLVLLLVGTLSYMQLEEWTFLDSLYFTSATVTTIGYGDITPVTNLGKTFTIIFSFLGVGMAFYFFTLFGNYIYKKAFQKEFNKHKEKLIDHIESKVEEEIESKGKIKKKKKK